MFFLALRHLTSRKRQTFLTLLGIVLGTAAYVTISGMMLGFQTFIVDKLVNNDSHVRISARQETLTEHSMDSIFFGEDTIVNWLKPPSGRKDNPYILDPPSWLERLANDESVEGYSPQLVIQVIANGGKSSLAGRVIGSEPNRQIQVTNIEKYMVKGHFMDIAGNGNRIIAGDGFLKNLGVTVHETIGLSVGKGSVQPFKIVGAFNLGVKSLDDTTIFASLKDVQKLNQTPSRISDIAVRLRDVREAGSVAETWNVLSQEKVQSWDQANEGIMSVFTTQDIVRNTMTVSILIVAGFGIYNILSLAVSHKRKEIAILRSIGFEPKDILNLFLVQGLFLGIIGGLVGSLLGYFICLYLSTIEVSAARGLGGNTMILSFDYMIYVTGFALAFFSASAASILPARAAGKLDPIEIIRSENS